MLSVKTNNNSKYKETRKTILEKFNENMFKYAGYREALDFSRKTFNSLIKDAVASENITNAEIVAACKETQNEDEKKEIEAFLLSYLYVFIDEANVKSLGPGDIASEEYFKLNDGLQTEMTRMFNDLTNASFVLSVYLLPNWFALPTKTTINQIIEDSTPYLLFFYALPPTISTFEQQRYQDFWTEYNNHREKIRFVCNKEKIELCSEEQNFDLWNQKSTYPNKKERVHQADLLSAPCYDIRVAKEFNFREVEFRKSNQIIRSLFDHSINHRF